MKIDLHIPTNWQELTREQLLEVVEMSDKGLSREEYLLVLFCRFSGIKMIAGTIDQDDKKVIHVNFKDQEDRVFGLSDWQVAEFCSRLSFLLEDMPIDIVWPFKWDRYLFDTTFGSWFHADAMILRFTIEGNPDYLATAMKDLGDPREGKPSLAETTLLLKWYGLFKDWLLERYPLVFQKVKPGQETAASPVEARQNIMLMLNECHPQDNEKIEESNVHDVLAALQHKIEETNSISERLKGL